VGQIEPPLDAVKPIIDARHSVLNASHSILDSSESFLDAIDAAVLGCDLRHYVRHLRHYVRQRRFKPAHASFDVRNVGAHLLLSALESFLSAPENMELLHNEIRNFIHHEDTLLERV